MDVSHGSTTAAGKPDCFAHGHLVAWFLFSLLFYFSDQLDRSFRLYLLVIPLMALPAISLVIVWVFALASSIWRQRWRYLTTVALSPLLVFGTVLLMRSVYDSDWLRFQSFRSRYEQAAQDLHQRGGSYREWNWGDTGGVAVANIFHKLVYDESSRTASSAFSSDQHSLDVRPLGEHFYLVTEIYQ
ncbi:hypothetical protein [Paraburkholderia guartelaensis]|uniref:hypothetical protein n=1 Tax=Paraburkholderia guartelaensis TaxID=2546446 RepID=UPI002AB719AE|nr:hypothetical protein [Paraburkholderia guartelaensis]